MTTRPRGKKPKVKSPVANGTRIKFLDDRDGQVGLSVERNRGQLLFDSMPEAFLIVIVQRGFYLERVDAEKLHAWLGQRLAEVT